MFKLASAFQSVQVQEKVADTAAGVAIVGASYSWISQANEILTMIATITAIAAGCFAARYHYKKTKLLDTMSPSAISRVITGDDE